MKVGDAAELQKRFSEKDVQLFSTLSEDRNPIHLDESYASSTRFGRRIVHGMLTSSLFSAILGTKLPGKGSIYMSQNLSFKAPIFLDELVTARYVLLYATASYSFSIHQLVLITWIPFLYSRVEVKAVHPTKPVVTFSTKCTNEKGVLCVDGEAVVYVPHHARKREEPPSKQ